MRHGKKINHLSRKSSHRSLMLSNMACSLIEHKRIRTTLAKAKALRRYVEPIITKSKDDTVHNRRLVFRELRDKYAVSGLFRDISSKIGDRPGGYTRVIKLGNRLGDNADMAIIELVDFNDTYNLKGARKSTRRGRRKSSGNTAGVSSETSAPADKGSKNQDSGQEEGTVQDVANESEKPVT